jgi:hypothetical protein
VSLTGFVSAEGVAEEEEEETVDDARDFGCF